jgi:prepilin-type N-terminal cleavage/methylation domain-containing protein
MLALQAYLKNPKTRKVLARRPGDEGFSLIELVVVVAVLAILAAIAIPAFTSIQDNANQAAAKNTIAQIAKECAVKVAAGDAGAVFNVPKLSSYTITPASGDCTPSDDTVEATVKANQSSQLPEVITYNVETGAKTCTAGDNAAWCEDGAW